MLCKSGTETQRRFQRDVLIQMSLYLVVVLLAAEMVRHHAAGHYATYFWAILAAMPICGVVIRMARYLSEETDEFQKMMAMQAILFGTAALLVALVIDDFLRAFAKVDGLPPFWGFMIFCAGMAATGVVQKFRYRVWDEE
jgi:uncharacterized protein YacL